MDNPSEKNTGTHPCYSVVIPVYNSATILPKLHERLTNVMQSLEKAYEVIFVDDCGPDNSWQVIHSLTAGDPHITGIQLMRNSGQGASTLCGLSHARGEIVITIDDDLQHPPTEIPRLLALLEEDEDLDVIMGVEKEKRHSAIRRFGSSLINQVNSFFLKKDPNLRFTSFRVMRKGVVRGLLEQRTQYPALGPMIVSVTHRIRNELVQHNKRLDGESGYTFSRIVKQTMSNFIGYSMLPLRLLAFTGLFGIAGSLVLALYFLTKYFYYGVSVPGWTTSVMLITILSGFNFLAFSILGEFILRILHAANGMPQYVARQVITSQPSPSRHEEAPVITRQADTVQVRSHTSHQS